MIDLAAVMLALGGAAVLRFGLEGALDVADPISSAPWPFAPPIWIGAIAAFGLYNYPRCANAVEEARRLMGAGFAAPVAFVLMVFLYKHDPSRLWVGTATLLGLVTLGIGRRALRQLGLWHRRRGRWMTSAVVVGRQEAKRLVDLLIEDPAAGYVPVATAGFEWDGLPSSSLDDIETAMRDSGASAVLVVSEDMRREEVSRAIAVADRNPASVIVLPGLDFTLAHRLHVVPVAREPGLALESPSLYTSQRAMKRTMDIGLSAIGLVPALPVMGLASLAIKLDSRGPVFFRQKRVGLDGRLFGCLKFRTMIEGAEEQREELTEQNEADGVLFKLREDPRLTRVGRVLRRWSLDEVPQIWNVLRGDMSLVGPRPLPESDYALPGEEGALRRRLNVRPGLTGLWQIGGRSELGSEDFLRLDLTYVQNWSLLLDLYVMVRTMPAVLSGRGAT